MAGASTDLLLVCLDDIRAGRVTLEACIAEYPQMAAELRSLAPVTSALRFSNPPELDSAAKVRTRNQLLAAISSNGHHPAEDRRMMERLGRLWARPRWAAAMGGALAALTAGGAVVYAAQGAPPESPLYPVRTAVEVVTRAVAPASPAGTAVLSTVASGQSKAGSEAVVLPPRAATPAVGVVRNNAAASAPGQQRRPDTDRDRDVPPAPLPTAMPSPEVDHEPDGVSATPSGRDNPREGNGNQNGNGNNGNGNANGRGPAGKPGDVRGGDDRPLQLTATPGPGRREGEQGADKNQRG